MSKNKKKPDWCNFSLVGDRARMNLYGEIYSWDAAWFIEELSEIDVPDIDLHINSLGGSITAGIGIYTNLRAHPAKVNVVVDGEASSIASYIAMAGDTIKMAADGLWLVHKPIVSNLEMVNEDDLVAIIQDLQLLEKSIVGRYVEKTGKTEDEIKDLMKEDRYMSAEEALEWGFVDEIIDALELVAKSTREKFQNAGRGKQQANQPKPKKEDTNMSVHKDKLVALCVVGRNASDEDALSQLETFVNQAKQDKEDLKEAKATIETLNTRVEELETENSETAIEGFTAKVDAAIENKRVKKEQKDALINTFKACAKAGQEMLDSFVAPKAPTTGTTAVDGAINRGGDGDDAGKLPEKNEDGSKNYTNIAKNRKADREAEKQANAA